MLLVDAGTSYYKVFNVKDNTYKIYNILDACKIKQDKVILATGHNKNYFKKAKKINELVALSKGAIKKINKNNFTVIDVGSRDIKLIDFRNKQFSNCNWNSSCGAMIGFTLELMNKYFNININDLKENKNYIDITCGLLGITKFFDIVSKENSKIDDAISSLVYGMARYTWVFSDKKSQVYLSGGLSENKLFINYLNKLTCKVTSLGRFTLLEGLKTYL